MVNMPLPLQVFVNNVNDSLQQLGAAKLTADELKLLLATAPLPSVGGESSTTTSNKNTTKDKSKCTINHKGRDITQYINLT